MNFLKASILTCNLITFILPLRSNNSANVNTVFSRVVLSVAMNSESASSSGSSVELLDVPVHGLLECSSTDSSVCSLNESSSSASSSLKSEL